MKTDWKERFDEKFITAVGGSLVFREYSGGFTVADKVKQFIELLLKEQDENRH